MSEPVGRVQRLTELARQVTPQWGDVAIMAVEGRPTIHLRTWHPRSFDALELALLVLVHGQELLTLRLQDQLAQRGVYATFPQLVGALLDAAQGADHG